MVRKVRMATVMKSLLVRNTINKEHTKVPNVKGMNGMDAISLLENIGLKVSVQGFGKVQNQSIKKGGLLKKGATITLKLS